MIFWSSCLNHSLSLFTIALYGWNELWWSHLPATSPLVYDVCNLLAPLHNTCSPCEASESKIVMFGGWCSSFEAKQSETVMVLRRKKRIYCRENTLKTNPTTFVWFVFCIWGKHCTTLCAYLELALRVTSPDVLQANENPQFTVQRYRLSFVTFP